MKSKRVARIDIRYLNGEWGCLFQGGGRGIAFKFGTELDKVLSEFIEDTGEDCAREKILAFAHGVMAMEEDYESAGKSMGAVAGR